MGLDQFGKARNPQTEEVIEIAYWRKHNALHGWMERLWRDQGGSGDFNCVPLELTKENLERLREIVEADALPATEGFFFGRDSRHDETCKRQTLTFIQDAIRYLDDGWQVAYDSWW